MELSCFGFSLFRKLIFAPKPTIREAIGTSKTVKKVPNKFENYWEGH